MELFQQHRLIAQCPCSVESAFGTFNQARLPSNPLTVPQVAIAGGRNLPSRICTVFSWSQLPVTISQASPDNPLVLSTAPSTKTTITTSAYIRVLLLGLAELRRMTTQA